MPNRLIDQTSPYLLQHANNPVDWWPWCDEAFELANRTDRPVFLSIGYSACHWCHVMERESFESHAIAKILNEHFVSIKVDREERPDIDQVYMQAVMALMGGHGGWPLSAFLTPDQHVFYGGTYWPPEPRMGQPAFPHVLRRIHEAWSGQREQLVQQSRQITAWLEDRTNGSAQNTSTEPDDYDTAINLAIKRLAEEYDGQNGGFGTTPKFPHAMVIEFLMNVVSAPDYRGDLPRDSIVEMIRGNLDGMAKGGIYDHVGGGFARYSVDEMWLVPHFEKMLYDNALLAGVYSLAARLFRKSEWETVARETLDYLLRDMQDASGGFHSAEDADSEGEEGKFYVWSTAEVKKVLGSEAGERFCAVYDITETGNFEGNSIPNLLRRSIGKSAEIIGIDRQELENELLTSRKKLLHQRASRIRPGKDDKILTSWNGLAITAFSRASIAFSEPRYAAAAEGAAQFIRNGLTRDDGRLLHSYRNARTGPEGFLDDYSYMVVALIDLYLATWNEGYLEWGVDLTYQMLNLFGNDNQPTLYFTANDVPRLITRMKDEHDSSVPGSNAMAATALIRLGSILGNEKFVERGTAILDSAIPLLRRAPVAAGQAAIAISSFVGGMTSYVVVANTHLERDEIVHKIRSRNILETAIVARISGEPASDILNPVFTGRMIVDNGPALYVCTLGNCLPPMTGMKEISEFFENGKTENG